MDGVTNGNNDNITYDTGYLPLPIIHKEFSISARKLAASRTTGAPLDTTAAEICARKVATLIETTAITGANSYGFGGGSIYGLTDFPSRQTYVMATDWSTATGDAIVKNVLHMINLARLKFFDGPYLLMIPSVYSEYLGNDYKAASDKSILSRIKEIDGVGEIMFTARLGTGNVVLTQLSTDVVRIVNGLNITTVQWTSPDKMRYHFKVMAIQVPQYRADKDGNCGIVHCALA